MGATDYILGLLTIVTGLAITDMIVSLHGLLMNRREVKWDWLPLMAAAFVLLAIINVWRMTYVAFQGSERGPPIWVFVMILAANFALYLAARASLPDRVILGEPLNLRAYYDFVDRYLWSAVASLYGCFMLINLLGLMTVGKIPFSNQVIQALAAFPFIVALVIWPNRKLHRIVVPLLFFWLCVRVLPGRLLTL